jgi:hypothetical protein
MKTLRASRRIPRGTPKKTDRYFVEPDPDSNEVIAESLSQIQQACTSEFVSIPGADGKNHSVWEMSYAQIQNLVVERERQQQKFGFQVWRILSGSERAMFFEAYSRSSSR